MAGDSPTDDSLHRQCRMGALKTDADRSSGDDIKKEGERLEAGGDRGEKCPVSNASRGKGPAGETAEKFKEMSEIAGG